MNIMSCHGFTTIKTVLKGNTGFLSLLDPIFPSTFISMIKGFILSSHKVLGTCHEAMGQDMVSVVKLLPLSSGKFQFFAIAPVWLEGQQVKSFSLGIPMVGGYGNI